MITATLVPEALRAPPVVPALSAAVDPSISVMVPVWTPPVPGAATNAPVAVLGRAFPAPSATRNRIPAVGTINPSGNVSSIATSKTPPAPAPVLSTTMAKRTRSAASTSSTSAPGAPPDSASLVTVPVKPGSTAPGPGSNQATPVGFSVSVMVRPPAFGLPAPITPLAMSSAGSASASCVRLVADAARPNELAERFTTWLVTITPSWKADVVTPIVSRRSISDGLFVGSSCVP